MLKVNHVGEMRVSYEPGVNSQIRFWVDQWYQNCTLATRYYTLFTQCTNPNILLADVVHSQGRLVKFRTSLVGIDFQEWT